VIAGILLAAEYSQLKKRRARGSVAAQGEAIGRNIYCRQENIL
jgi:hypothetical protein